MLVLIRTNGMDGKICNKKCNANYITDVSIISARDFQIFVKKITILFILLFSIYALTCIKPC